MTSPESLADELENSPTWDEFCERCPDAADRIVGEILDAGQDVFAELAGGDRSGRSAHDWCDQQRNERMDQWISDNQSAWREACRKG